MSYVPYIWTISRSTGIKQTGIPYLATGKRLWQLISVVKMLHQKKYDNFFCKVSRDFLAKTCIDPLDFPLISLYDIDKDGGSIEFS